MFSKQTKVVAWVCFLLLVPALMVGCGEQKKFGTVNGKVTLDGQPMTKGCIEFINSGANIAVNANLNEDGTYEIKTYDMGGLPPGTYKIAIKGAPIRPTEELMVGMEEQAPKPAFVPPMYRNPNTSKMEAVVKEGENDPFNFDMKK